MSDTFTPQINLRRLRKGKNLIFNQKYWPILQNWKGKATITGSAALYAFGLIDRLPNDIDFLVDSSTFEPGRKLYTELKRYSGMTQKLNMIGWYTQSGYNVDFFHNANHSKIICDGHTFHHPFEIIQKKIEIHESSNSISKIRRTDYEDVLVAFKKIKPDYNLVY